jgi:tetratricopeptide (TPR) repeat protein
MKFKKTTNSVPEIARKLNVDGVVQATLKRERGKVQMAVRLFKRPTDRPLWSANYERDLRDVFVLQNEVALAIASKMKVKLQPEEEARLVNAPRVNPEALDLYYRRNAIALASGDANNKEAIRLLERAVKISEDFAPAWAALAGAYIDRFYLYEPENYKQLSAEAQTAVLKALQLDRNLAEAYVQHGRLLWSPGKNFQHEAALGLFYDALELNASSVRALRLIGWVYNHTGFFDDAIAKDNEATALDPLGARHSVSRACSLVWKGEYKESLSLWPPGDDGGLPLVCGSHWAWALFALGQTNEANDKLQEYLKKYPEDDPGELTAMKAVLLAAAGDEAGAIEQIKIAEKKTETSFGETHHATYLIACAYARLNRTSEALRWLKQTADTGFPCYPLFAKDPNLDNLRRRNDPEFVAFLTSRKQTGRSGKRTGRSLMTVGKEPPSSDEFLIRLRDDLKHD